MRRLAICSVLLLVVSACGDDDTAGEESAAPTTSAGQTTTTGDRADEPEEPTEAEAGEARYREVVEALADDEMEGRDNLTAGSELAQELLIGELEEFAEPLGDEFRHAFAEGTNIVGMIPGTELPDEYLVLGAHYDHLGRDCPSEVPGDDICSGAADNAAGVAAVLEIGRGLAADGPRRSVVLALWDAEEDGLLGSGAYVADPLVPLDQTVAYLNFDILGSNLLPSLADVTIMVGTETGGPDLVDAATEATSASDLDVLALSLLFGQGRSDHAVFETAGVPIVFFTDSTSGCYHTAQDDTTTLDFDKLGRQIAIGDALARDLVETEAVPEHVADAPLATYEDAESMLAVVSRAEDDFDPFPAEDRDLAAKFLTDLESMVEAGPDEFGDDDLNTLLGGSVEMVRLLAEGDCDGHFD